MPDSQGLPQLDKALAVLAQINMMLSGYPAVIALGASIVQMIKGAGHSTAEAQAEVDKFNATVNAAADFNAQWRADHPRTD